MDIRSITDEAGRRQAFALFREAMLGIGDLGRSSPEAEARFLRDGKPFGAYEGDVLRGVVNGYDSSVTLPGGERVSHLSVTHVGVAPDATRRGVARRLLVDQLRRARAEGFVVAGLRASDPCIYGRYGYGIASWSVRQDVDLTRTRLAPGLSRDGVRIVDARESFDLFRRIAETDPNPRAAALSRWNGWWSMQEYRTAHATTPHHAVVFGAQGRERGFVRFHVEPADNWFLSARRTVTVDDLVAHDGEAWRALNGHLLSQDILHRVVFPSRPIDDPLPLLLSNPRALEISDQRDESWIRPLDLKALLSARRLGGTRDVTIAVEDDLFDDNAGIWSVGPSGAVKSYGKAEASLTVANLATLLFGAQSATHLAASGRLGTDADGVVDDLDSMFAISRKPHSGISF